MRIFKSTLFKDKLQNCFKERTTISCIERRVINCNAIVTNLQFQTNVMLHEVKICKKKLKNIAFQTRLCSNRLKFDIEGGKQIIPPLRVNSQLLLLQNFSLSRRNLPISDHEDSGIYLMRGNGMTLWDACRS